MIFHENYLLADDSHEISYPIFRKLGKMSQTSSSAVVIGALRVKKSTKILCADSKYTNVVEENFIIG